uniref:Uncharacterized protein n=1 Tax=Physcomitrium patens TaxID=3218 RepID=A0A2K1JHD3_PHYPA|nr:hypothetical protein PHYPA_018365 [Physcomitrium patens]
MWEAAMLSSTNIWKISIDRCRLCGMPVSCVSYIGRGRSVSHILRKTSQTPDISKSTFQTKVRRSSFHKHFRSYFQNLVAHSREKSKVCNTQIK